MVVWIGGFDANLSMPGDDQVSKKPKLQANLLSVVTSVAMELESVSDENFES
jgi:hypothetical protein